MTGSIILKTLFVFAVLAIPLLFLLSKRPEGKNSYGPPGIPLGFKMAVNSFFANYANFKGRASRSEFWYATLFYQGLSVIFTMIDQSDIIVGIFTLICIIPSFAVATRRLHDINRIGGYQAVALAFPVGTLITIYWYCKPPSDLEQPLLEHVD